MTVRNPPSSNILLRGGVVLDGLGAARRRADVAIADGRIVEVGACDGFTADLAIDVEGAVVAPGFIDVHAHDDHACIVRPGMTPKLSQGVTTVVVGNCGISAAPLTFPADPIEPFNLLGAGPDFRYRSFDAYVAAVDAARPSVNVCALMGHSTLRAACMSDLSRGAAPRELEAMRRLLAEALEAGALGMSSGLFYAPAWAADAAELAVLAHDVAEAGGVCTAHIRNEYDGVAEALAEAFSTVAEEGPTLVISHHKCAGMQNWGRSAETLGLIDAARRTRNVALDCYPYTAGSTVIRPELADGKIEVLVNWSTPFPEMSGRTLRSISEEWGCDQAQAAERLKPGGASYFQVHEDDMRRILAHPACMIGSDGLPNDPLPHPRLWGAFPRVLGRYVRDLGLLTLENAVHKMTGLAARTFNVPDRGVIAPGKAADIAIFDPDRIEDRATFADPCQFAAGLLHVLVDGRLAWSEGGPTDDRRGRFLKRGRKDEA